jgi:hypothetical protein
MSLDLARLMNMLSVVSDSVDGETPPVDALHFDRYVDPLSEIITNDITDTPFTVGIFGRWGSGKTTLMRLIEGGLGERAGTSGRVYTVIWFNPWLYQSEENLIVPLLHTIRDTLLESRVERIKDTAKLVGTIIAQISASALLKSIGAGSLSFEDLEKRFKAQLDRRAETMSTIRTLRKQLQQVVNGVTGDGREGRVILFIDDLDRCVPTKIVALLEAIKLFLDLKHTILFLAIDREIVQRGIQAYYKDLKVEGAEIATLTSDYLDKMIQLPFYLHPLGSKQIQTYLTSVSEAKDVQEQAPLLATCLHPNPRKIKRVINIYRLYRAVMEGGLPATATGAERKRHRDMLAKLIILQQQWGALYEALVTHPDLAATLERVYRGDLPLNKVEQWAFLKERQTAVRALCERYYAPGSTLEALFTTGQTFKDVELADYLHMLG